MNNADYIALIDDASVYDVARKSPLELAGNLSQRLNNRILMKREDLQPVFSFKLRGAYNKLASLPDSAVASGVICSSAGNHAQGVALAAGRRGTRALIVMPVTTPSIKVDAVAALGGEVVLHGDNYDEAYARALELADAENLAFIHPFDDPAVIAGQGTIGRELVEQMDDDVSAVFVPIGGGGLIAGIAAYLKAKRPDVRIVGVEPEDSAAMKISLDAGEPVTLDHVGIFADGVAVRRVGDETFRLCQRFVDEIVTVDTDQICAGIKDIFEDTRSIVEPAGALAVAGVKKYVSEHDSTGQSFVVINCGANVNFDRLRHIAERAAVGEQQEMLLAVEIPEKPGSFRDFCNALGRRGITDEMAKLHIRHMVGGSAGTLKNESPFRFEFPERPGALLDFLLAIGTDWNISLFHYRNHGSDHGRVLAGIQVPNEESDELEAHLAELGYAHFEESDNPAYRMFLT
jgi:threonine dehydratase